VSDTVTATGGRSRHDGVRGSGRADDRAAISLGGSRCESTRGFESHLPHWSCGGMVYTWRLGRHAERREGSTPSRTTSECEGLSVRLGGWLLLAL
jgi:hypothetical protein